MSTYNSARSALLNFFTSYKQRVPSEFVDSLKLCYSGLKRDDSLRKQQGEGKVQEGKEAISYSLYTLMGSELLEGSARNPVEAAFTHCMLTMSWNLMCRYI